MVEVQEEPEKGVLNAGGLSILHTCLLIKTVVQKQTVPAKDSASANAEKK